MNIYKSVQKYTFFYIIILTKIVKKGEQMSRVNTNKRKDAKIFKRTAQTTKKVNLAPKTMRGGTRL